MKIKNFISKNKKYIKLMLIGGLMSAPMMYTIFSEESPGHLSPLEFVSLFVFLLGGPMFMYGFVSCFIKTRSAPVDSTVDLDVTRIRIAVETDNLWRKQ